MEFSTCARCLLPVKLDASLTSQFLQSQYDLLASQFPLHPVKGPTANAAAQLACLPPSIQTAYTSASTEVNANATSSKRAATSQVLFDILSQNTEIDHPLCAECADSLQDRMNQQLADVKAERERYLAYERQVVNDPNARMSETGMERLQEEIAELERQEQQTLVELKEAEAENAILEQQLKDLDVEDQALELEERQ